MAKYEVTFDAASGDKVSGNGNIRWWSTTGITNAIKKLLNTALIPTRETSTIFRIDCDTSIRFSMTFLTFETKFGTKKISRWSLNKFGIDTDAKLFILDDFVAIRYN